MEKRFGRGGCVRVLFLSVTTVVVESLTVGGVGRLFATVSCLWGDPTAQLTT